jgi:DNA-binding MarR family transcriptional regulator
LARRKVDPADRRSILVQRTTKGTAFLRDLRSTMDQATDGSGVRVRIGAIGRETVSRRAATT